MRVFAFYNQKIGWASKIFLRNSFQRFSSSLERSDPCARDKPQKNAQSPLHSGVATKLAPVIPPKIARNLLDAFALVTGLARLCFDALTLRIRQPHRYLRE